MSVKKKRTECHKKPVKKDWIKDLVVSEAMKMVMDDKAIEAIVSMLMDLQDRENVNLPLYGQQLREVRRWLDIYFSGHEPDFMPPIHMIGSDFQLTVWELLTQIPYGETTTYGELAKRVAQKRGLPCMSAQAVGGAVGHNEISIIVPCHRVVGTGGSLTGYAGGVDRKQKLLTLEGADMTGLFVPTKGTAL